MAESGIKGISLTADRPLNGARVTAWLNDVLQAQGPDILRLRGILAFKDDPERYVVQGVHMIIEGNHQRKWKDAEKRESRLVFIGRNLDEAKLRKAFEACLA